MAKSRLLQYIEFIPLKVLLLIVGALPLFLAVRLGALLGFVLYVFSPSQKRIVKENLKTAFNNKYTEIEIKKLTKEIFKNFGRTIFEFMKLPSLTTEKILGNVNFKNMHIMDNALAKGKGVICVTAHIGNWEMMAASYASTGRSLYTIVRPLDNLLLDKYVENFREQKKVHVIPRGTALRRGFKALKQGAVLAFLIDQNAAMHGVFVPFFNKLASTVKGPAILALKNNTPVVFGYSIRNKDNSHSVVFVKEFELLDGANFESSVINNMKQYTEEIEKVVRQYPEQWLWMHPRWKKRPSKI